MRTNVHIHLRRVIDDSYDIEIGCSLGKAAGDINRRYRNSSKFIITDANVAHLYGKKLLGAIGQPRSHLLVVPAGEKTKSRRTKDLLEDKLISLKADRDSVIIALGGGMIGDLAGFVASTLFRGLAYVQIPTTLLAQVDSSIGGKVAVDHPRGKNLIGAFYQPKKVYIDPTTLETLSDSEFSSGMAEVIKYAAILDTALFGYLEEHSASIRAKNFDVLRHVITRCCELKKAVVQQDERETGLRRILNYGHTIGHAVELLSRYRVPHGHAVAIGMVAEARMSVRIGLLSTPAFVRLKRLIAAHRLPTELPKTLRLQSIIAATSRDKKAKGAAIHYTLLERLGRARVGVPLSASQVHTLLGR